jgi:hypothetical protein
MSAGAPLIVVVAGAARSTSSTRDAVGFPNHSVATIAFHFHTFSRPSCSRRGNVGHGDSTPVEPADACGQQPPPKQQ